MLDVFFGGGIAQILLYTMALGLPSAWIVGWLYRSWRKANLPAFWAWILQQRRRDKTIRTTREQVVDLEQRLGALEEKVGGSMADQKNDERDDITERLEDTLIRLGAVERLVAQLRHRLRSKGIMIDG